MNGNWIREGSGPTAIVFVHGVLSDGEACWTNKNGTYWPTLVADDAACPNTGVYVFTYKTGFFSGTYRLGDVVDSLKEHMELDDVLNYKRIIFVCHSMGGLVARKFVVERAVELVESKKEVGFFLVASPALGSKYADWLSPLAQLFGHAQADVLRFASNNAWLMDLDKEFQNLKSANKLAITGKELVEDVFIVLTPFIKRQVVEPFAGARYFGEAYKVPDSDHFTIAKPDGGKAIQHRILRRFISNSSKHLLTAPELAADALTNPL
jgi:pimeloyl-ACP methyl ester carboxylesterase